MFFKFLPYFFVIILLSGCQYPFEFRSTSEIRQEVLDNDPAFESVLQKKAEIDEKIASLNAEQSLKAREIESRMLSLKRELQLSRQNAAERVASLESQLDPQRSEIKQRITEFSTELKLNQSSLSAVRKMIADLNRLKGQRPAQEQETEDSLRLREKIETQQRQAESLTQDIADLRAKIRLLRLKLKLLQ
jgi:uncharacterized protein YdcH (DUF465 family)